MKAMITPEQALATILEKLPSAVPEMVAHAEALGRVLARDIRAPFNLPPFDNSAMDGYAVQAADLRGAGPQGAVTLAQLEIIGAGQVGKTRVVPGTCSRIMTGAPLPPGADAVVMREDTRELGDQVEFLHAPQTGENIRHAGSDVSSGERVLKSGTVVRASEWAMLASMGCARVAVYRRPRVAIIATGAELVEVGAPLQEGQIYDSNSFALQAAAAEAGADVLAVLRVGDNVEEVEAALRQFAPLCDAIITSGGVSAGDYDPVRDVLHEHATVHFWKVAMKPGKPLLYASLGNALVFGLPGNPVSVMVAMERFVRPALLVAGGRRAWPRFAAQVRLKHALKSPGGRVEFARACVTLENGEWLASTTGDQGSGRLSSMVGANALLEIPANVTSLAAGDHVLAHLTDWPEQLAVLS